MTMDAVEACHTDSKIQTEIRTALLSALDLGAKVLGKESCLCDDGRYLPESKITLTISPKGLPVPLPRPILPDSLASTADVQAYLGGLLVHTYSVELECAQAVVDQCHFQRGWHLRSATLAPFRRLCGRTNGELLFRAVEVDKIEEQRQRDQQAVQAWWENEGSDKLTAIVVREKYITPYQSFYLGKF